MQNLIVSELARHLNALQRSPFQFHNPVALARALANEPRLLLADEPTGALDSGTSQLILDLLAELRERRGMTLVIVSYDPQVGERADRMLTVVDGVLTPPAPDLAAAKALIDVHSKKPTFTAPGAPFDAKACMAGISQPRSQRSGGLGENQQIH